MSDPNPGQPNGQTSGAIIRNELMRGLRGGLFWSITIYGGLVLSIFLFNLAIYLLSNQKEAPRERIARILEEGPYVVVGTIAVWTAIAGLVGLIRGFEKARAARQLAQINLGSTTAASDHRLEQARKWRMLRCVLVGTALAGVGVIIELIFKTAMVIGNPAAILGNLGLGATIGWMIGLLIDLFEWLTTKKS